MYIALITAEALIGLICLGMIYSWFGWPILIISAAALFALLGWLLIRCKKFKSAGDTAMTKKTLRHIALALLIPIAAALIVIGYTVISMFLYFG